MNLDHMQLPLKKYIFAFAAAFLLTVAFHALLGVFFSFLPPGEKVLNVLGNFSSYFSVFLAALFCARLCGKRGFFTGMVCGDIYMALLVLAGIIILRNSYGMIDIIKIFSFSSFCGILGGIIGINFK